MGLRILFGCAFLNQHGGFENYVQALAESALKAGHEATILTPYKVRDDATIRRLPASVAFTSAQERWRRTPGGRAALLLSRSKFRLLRRRAPSYLEETQLARRPARSFVERFWRGEGGRLLDGFDVVHLVGKPKRFLVDAAGHARALGKRVVYSEVAHVDRRYAEQPDHRDFVGRSNDCDLVLTYSELQLAGIREWFEYSGPARVIDQFAYVNEAELLAIERRPEPRENDGFVLGALCRLSPEKDLGLLLRALASVRERHPGLRVHIAGTGACESELKEVSSRLDLRSRVTFLGYVADTADFYRSVDAFVITSREEGGPITGVEAMAAALPIVSTRTNAMPERLREGREALYFDVGSVEGLSEALGRLAADRSLRSALGAAARKRYVERCHSRVCETALIAAWDELGARRC